MKVSLLRQSDFPVESPIEATARHLPNRLITNGPHGHSGVQPPDH